MKATKLVLEGIKKALKDGEATISFRKEDKKSKKEIANLDEASALTGSGLDVGGKTYFDEAFAALRYANPFRIGSRQIAVTDTSAVQFVAKVGNATNSTSGHNPWGYTFTPNNGNPNYATNIWQLPTRVISAQLPIRTAILGDVNYLEEAIVKDLFLEFSNKFELLHQWTVNGNHYAKTSELWLLKMDKNKKRILEIFRSTYGGDFKIWWNRWRVFYLACAEFFAFNHGEEWHVVHYLFLKPKE